MSQISAREKVSHSHIQTHTHTHCFLIDLSQQTQKIEQRELTEAKRQQSILEFPWQLVMGKESYCQKIDMITIVFTRVLQ